jgi:maleate isomerase
MPGAAISPVDGAVDLSGDEAPRLGLILLATDMTTERDVARLIPPDEAAVHATRVAYVNPTTPDNLRRMGPLLSAAAALLVPGADLRAIYYSCTAASVVIGEDAVGSALELGRPGVRAVTPIGAAARALRALGARRIAVLTPYLEEPTAAVVRHLEDMGFDVVQARCLGMSDDREMALVSAQKIIEAACQVDTSEADALFISCTALPALSAVAEIEAALGKPVVTSNQAGIWEMRRLAGLTAPVTGYGRVFAA